jgi:hypothetical protein
VHPHFRLQGTWLGCNGVVALFALALALLTAVALLARRSVR